VPPPFFPPPLCILGPAVVGPLRHAPDRHNPRARFPSPSRSSPSPAIVPRASASSGIHEGTAAGELCRRPNFLIAGRSPPQQLPKPIRATKEPRALLLQPVRERHPASAARPLSTTILHCSSGHHEPLVSFPFLPWSFCAGYRGFWQPVAPRPRARR
jgi:hypothetical protein